MSEYQVQSLGGKFTVSGYANNLILYYENVPIMGDGIACAFTKYLIAFKKNRIVHIYSKVNRNEIDRFNWAEEKSFSVIFNGVQYIIDSDCNITVEG